jgi:hypothetical protein
VDPLAANTHQKHDMSPGISPSGLFWTVRIPEDWVSVDGEELGEGARYRVENLSLLDYGKLANSLPAFLPPGTEQTPPDAADATFDMHFMGNTGPANATDPGENRFTFKGILTHATMAWSAAVPAKNFRFESDAADTSFETFAELVNEQNGSFFGSDGD